MSTHDSDQPNVTPPPAGPLTVSEISVAFGVSVSTVRRLLNENKLPNATKRKGTKGDEWVIPAGDMTALGYDLAGLQPKATGTDVTLVAVVSDYEKKLADLRKEHEAELATAKADHERLLSAIEDKHEALVITLTKEADHERRLREAIEETKNAAATLSVSLRMQLEQSQKRVLELETATAKRRWFSRQAKRPATDQTTPKTDP